MADTEELLKSGSIGAIGRAIRNGDISAVGVTDWYLRRIEAHNAHGRAINDVRTVSDRALKLAEEADAELRSNYDRGPLHGIPILLKDNILTGDGMPAAAGTAALVDFVPTCEATLVARLRRAGAIILGKSNMTELADYVSDIMPSEFSSAGGIVRNPHGLSYGRGQGSSVGSAAAVAASFAPAAIGTETQNSIQAPAVYSSVFGFKPTAGYVSRHGVVPLVPSQDSPGPITRCTDDAAAILAIISGPDPCDTASLGPSPTRGQRFRLEGLRGIRIGVVRSHQANRPEFAALSNEFEKALGALSARGAAIVDPCDLPAAAAIQELKSCVFRTEFKAAINAFLACHRHECQINSLSDLIAWNEEHPENIPYGHPLLIAANSTDIDERYIADRLRDFELCSAGGISGAVASHDVDVLIAPMAATAKCSGKAGSPVAAVPIGAGHDGSPIGITLHAPRGQDWKLLAISDAVERAIGSRLVPNL